MGLQMTLKAQSNFEKKEQSLRCHATYYQTILQTLQPKQHGTGIKTDTYINGTK